MAAQAGRKRRKKKSRYRGSMIVIFVIVLVLCAFFWYKTWDVHRQKVRNMETIAQLEAQIEDAKEERRAIEDRAEYMQSDAYIQDLARDKLGLVYDNEIIFKKDRN